MEDCDDLSGLEELQASDLEHGDTDCGQSDCEGDLYGCDLWQEGFIPDQPRDGDNFLLGSLHTEPRDFEHVISVAWNNLQSAAFSQSDPLAQMFGFFDDPLANMLDLNLCRPLQPHEDQQSFSGLAHELADSRICKRQKTGGSYMAFVSGSVTAQTWQEEREAKHQVALLRWLATIRQWEHIVKQLQGETTEKSLCILGDYFAGKAPATLLKRVASISFFCSYLHSVGTKFPSGEGHLYEYMRVSKINKEPCSRRKSVMEAISFVRFALSVDECALMVSSRRCMGAAKALLGGRKQAAPFLMTELNSLHKCLAEDENAWNRALAGAVLFTVYGRARW